MDNTNKQIVSIPNPQEISTLYLNEQTWLQMKARANSFIASAALPKHIKNAEQALYQMQVGLEMGLKPAEALQDLYTINGITGLWGKAITKRFNMFGYRIDFINESEELDKEETTAVVYDMTAGGKGEEVARQVFRFSDVPEAQKMNEEKTWDNGSKGYKGTGKYTLKAGWLPGANRRKKLRYMALNEILNTKMAHLLGSAAGIVEVMEDEPTYTQPDNVIDGEAIAETPEPTGKPVVEKAQVTSLKEKMMNRKAETVVTEEAPAEEEPAKEGEIVDAPESTPEQPETPEETKDAPEKKVSAKEAKSVEKQDLEDMRAQVIEAGKKLGLEELTVKETCETKMNGKKFDKLTYTELESILFDLNKKIAK